MKNLFYLFNFCLLTITVSKLECVAQTGIVKNINPTMGYSVLQGILSTKPIFQKSLDYNYDSFLELYFKTKKINLTNSFKTEFDFEKLDGINPTSVTKKYISYLKEFCIQNELKQLLIVNKKNSYLVSDPMKLFWSFNHDLGITVYTAYENRTMIYYNFDTMLYNLETNSVSRIASGNAFGKKFPKPVFDNQYNLDADVVEKLKLIFEQTMKQKFDKVFK